jgi:hypothetical protein
MPSRPPGIPFVTGDPQAWKQAGDGQGPVPLTVSRAINKLAQSLINRATPYIAYQAVASNTVDDQFHNGEAFSTQWRMPANTITDIGTVIELEIWGRHASAPSGSALQINIEIGPGVYLQKPNTSYSTGVVNDFRIVGQFLVTAVGKTGAMICDGQTFFDTGGAVEILMMGDITNPSRGIDFTLPQTWRVRPTWTPSGSVFVQATIDQIVITIWPPAPPQDIQPQVTFAYDSFTEASDVSLASHTPNISPSGIGWTNLGAFGLGTVQGGLNRVKMDMNGSGGANILWTIQTGYSDGTFYHTVQFDSTGNNSISDAGGMFRVAGSGDYILSTVSRGFPGCAIYKCVGGSFTQLALDSVSVVDDTIYNLVTTLNGLAMTASMNGRPAISVTLATTLHTTVTKHGLRYAGGTIHSFGYFLNPFKATYP